MKKILKVISEALENELCELIGSNDLVAAKAIQHVKLAIDRGMALPASQQPDSVDSQKRCPECNSIVTRPLGDVQMQCINGHLF